MGIRGKFVQLMAGTVAVGLGLEVTAFAFSDTCGPASSPSCFSVQRMPENWAQDRISPALLAEFEARKTVMIDAWYRGGRCDLSEMDFSGVVTGTPPTVCPSNRFQPGEFVGRICNLNAQPSEISVNRLGQSCGPTGAPAMACQRSYAFLDQLTGQSTNRTYAVSGNAQPIWACQLCQIGAGPSLTHPQYLAVTAIPDGDQFVNSVAAGAGSLSGSSCACCTLDVAQGTWQAERSWIRGAYVEAFVRAAARVRAVLQFEIDPKIRLRRLERGEPSLCKPLLDKMNSIRADLILRAGDLTNMSCSFDPGAVAGNVRAAFEANVSIASCLREAVNTYLNVTAYHLALCSALEDAEDFYVRLRGVVESVIQSHTCLVGESLSGCRGRLDGVIQSAIQSELSSEFPPLPPAPVAPAAVPLGPPASDSGGGG